MKKTRRLLGFPRAAAQNLYHLLAAFYLSLLNFLRFQHLLVFPYQLYEVDSF